MCSVQFVSVKTAVFRVQSAVYNIVKLNCPSQAEATGATETTRWAVARWRRSHDSRGGSAAAAGPG